MTHEQAIELINQYFDESLSAQDAEQLKLWLEEKPEHVDLFARYAIVHASLEHVLVTRDIGGTLFAMLNPDHTSETEDDSMMGYILNEISNKEHDDLDPLPIEDLPHLPATPPTRPRRKEDTGKDHETDLIFRMAGLRMYRTEIDPARQQRRPWFPVAATVMIAALIGLAFILTRPQAQLPAINADTPVATLTKARDLTWHEDSAAITLGDSLTPGSYEIRSGLARLTMQSGAKVLLQGPCKFELVNANAMQLITGQLTAKVPRKAKLFAVNTPTAEIVDLGTEFGVSVDPSGNTVAAVFKGKVHLAPASHDDDESEAGLVLTSGLQSSVDARGILNTNPQPIPNDHAFFRTLNESDYDLQLTGDVRFYRSPPIDTRLTEHYLRSHAIVFLESANTHVHSDILGVGTETRTYTAATFNEIKNTDFLPAGTTVDAYMLQFNPPDTVDSQLLVQMTVRFPRPILGVISRPAIFRNTDGLFGHPLVNYQNTGKTYGVRGIERVDTVDTVTISPDRMSATVSLDTRLVDQVRFLIESKPAE